MNGVFPRLRRFGDLTERDAARVSGRHITTDRSTRRISYLFKLLYSYSLSLLKVRKS